MTNTKTFNQVPYNTGSPFASDLITDTIIFNGFGFQNANVVTSFKDDQQMPEIVLNTFQNPIIDGGAVLNRRFASKDITLKGILKTTTASEMEALLDLFKLKTSAVEAYLDILIDGEYRRTKATCVKNDVFKRKSFDITRCPFEITFRTLDPFFYLKTKTTYIEAGVTANANIDLLYTGNARAEAKVYFFFGSVLGTNAISLQLNGNKIEIATAITTADVLIIDCVDKQVLLNGISIDYTGSFPTMQYGSNVFDIQFNGTFDCDISILYPKNFL